MTIWWLTRYVWRWLHQNISFRNVPCDVSVSSSNLFFDLLHTRFVAATFVFFLSQCATRSYLKKTVKDLSSRTSIHSACLRHDSYMHMLYVSIRLSLTLTIHQNFAKSDFFYYIYFYLWLNSFISHSWLIFCVRACVCVWIFIKFIDVLNA